MTRNPDLVKKGGTLYTYDMDENLLGGQGLRREAECRYNGRNRVEWMWMWMWDGANWFAYVNNDPVNFVDLWGLSANEPKSSFWKKAGDIVGKIIAAPVTVVGVVVGTVSVGISKLAGKGGSITLENNAITFTTGLNWKGSVTLGNTIIHANGSVAEWNSETRTSRYDGKAEVNLGKHEEAHTYQYQKYGILTPVLILGSAVINGGFHESNIHDFMGKSYFETIADDYAEIPGSRK
jgi:hypothetical protein